MTILQRFKAVKNTTLRSKLVKNYNRAYATRTANTYKGTDGSALLNGFIWSKSPEGYPYWADLFFADVDEGASLDQIWIKLYGGDLNARIKQLESAIRKTIRENKWLADGENCTLIHLKNVLKRK
jgi:hypothetical protein